MVSWIFDTFIMWAPLNDKFLQNIILDTCVQIQRETFDADADTFYYHLPYMRWPLQNTIKHSKKCID